MADRIEIKRQASFSLGNICSRCGNPVVRNADLQVRVERNNYAMFRSNLDPAGVADRQMIESLDLIQQCKSTHQPLGSLESTHGDSPWLWGQCTKKIDNATSATAFAHSVSAPCPVCGHVEAWQQRSAEEAEMNALQADNFPELFLDEERADLWARLNVLKILEKPGLLSEEDRKQIQGNYDQLLEEKESLLSAYHSPDRKAELDKLQERISELNSEIKKAGFFATKQKRALNEEREMTEAQYREKQKKAEQEEKELYDKIQTCSFQLHQLELLLKGCEGKIELTLSSTATAYVVV